MICFVYIILLTNFIYLYFFRFPYYNSEAFGLSQRIYSRYIEFASKRNIPIQVLSDIPDGQFRSYLFYSNAITKQTIPIIRSLNNNSLRWDNVEFTKTCPDLPEITAGKTSYILSEQSPCKKSFVGLPMIVIPSLSDGGTLQRIFNDKLCSAYTLSNFPFGFTLNDFNVEKLTERQFCQKFFIRYTEPRYLPQPDK